MAIMHYTYGGDTLGEFALVESVRPNKQCHVCGQRATVLVCYRNKPKVSEYVAKAKSLLIRNKKTGKFIRIIGINCGCYAKVHRQIAHIEGGSK